MILDKFFVQIIHSAVYVNKNIDYTFGGSKTEQKQVESFSIRQSFRDAAATSLYFVRET